MVEQKQNINSLRTHWNQFQLNRLGIGIGLLVICILAYGILSPSLGFFQDDWNFVYYTATGGMKSLTEFFNYDGHPTGAWSYVLSFKLLGFNPVAWQLYSVLWRFLAVLSFWWVIDLIWPESKVTTFMSATVFAVYPVFYLQAQAVSYFEVWVSFTFLWVSFYCSLRAIKDWDKAWFFIILAILFKIAHSFTTEYTWGLELTRPVLLWYMFSQTDERFRIKFRKVLLAWMPYLLIFLALVLWRGVFYVSPTVARSEPSFLNQFFQDPAKASVFFISNSLPDLILLLLTGWYKVLQPAMFNPTVRTNLFVLLIIGLATGVVAIVLAKLSNAAKDIQKRADTQALLIGIVAFFSGLMPFYAAGYFISIKLEPWNGRFALGSMPGIALITTAVLKTIISERRYQILVLALISGLAIGWQVRMGNQFRWAWKQQKDFYYQLTLRAPALAPGTSILSENEFLSFMGGYPTAFAINTLYTHPGGSLVGSNDPRYWFFPLSDFLTRLPDQLAGRPFSEKRAAVTFQGQAEGSVVIYYEPDLAQCLWVIRPEYVHAKALPQFTRQLAPISFVDRIQQVPQNQENSFLLKYLYPDPEKDWCYYYEKADLAYQYEEWDEIIKLWNIANESGLHPDNGFEYLPFIEALGQKQDWDTTKKLTSSSQKTMQGIEPLLCDIWSRLESNTPASAEKDTAIVSIREDLRCDQQ